MGGASTFMGSAIFLRKLALRRRRRVLCGGVGVVFAARSALMRLRGHRDSSSELQQLRLGKSLDLAGQWLAKRYLGTLSNRYSTHA